MRKQKRTSFLNLRFILVTSFSCLALIAFSQSNLVSSQAFIGQSSEQGELEVIHSDNFDTGVSATEYILNTSKGRKKLQFGEKTPALTTGTKIRINGVAANQGTITVADPEQQISVLAQAPTPSTTRNVAVIMMNFINNQKKPVGRTHIKKVTFTDTKSVNAFFQENSSGKVTLEGALDKNGDIFGWYKLPFTNTSCNISAWAVAADAAAKKDGFVASNYQSIIYYFPFSSSCLWSGAATAAGNPGRAWINGAYADYVVTHELGHNFTFAHANGYKCLDSQNQAVTLSEHCTALEYGDPFDSMGSGYFMHFNNAWKQKAGWYDSVELQTITSTGIYTLKPVESSANGIKALRIPRDTQTDFYLEYRQPLGFDTVIRNYPAVIKGISLRLGPVGTAYRPTYLLDATPTTQGFSFIDSSLQPGKTFSDPASGISVSTVSVSASGATVSVVIPFR